MTLSVSYSFKHGNQCGHKLRHVWNI